MRPAPIAPAPDSHCARIAAALGGDAARVGVLAPFVRWSALRWSRYPDLSSLVADLLAMLAEACPPMWHCAATGRLQVFDRGLSFPCELPPAPPRGPAKPPPRPPGGALLPRALRRRAWRLVDAPQLVLFALAGVELQFGAARARACRDGMCAKPFAEVCTRVFPGTAWPPHARLPAHIQTPVARTLNAVCAELRAAGGATAAVARRRLAARPRDGARAG